MENYIFVEYLSNVNDVVKQTFQSMQRIKLLCFDSSPSFLVFGASSGGIYIFKRDPCKFLKLIPSKEGAANLIAISKDEKHIGIASSKGLVLIFENFIDESSGQYQVFSEHEGKKITCIKWHGNELYAGDDCGKVSVVSVFTALFQKKSIFQIPSAALMTLDSSIVQIDAYQNYLLVSTRTKTFLCNTEKEHFIQIGKKLRDGCFGACFCGTGTDLLGTANANITQNVKNAFKTIKQEDLICAPDNRIKIYCARPGARLWEVGFDAKVLVTYQFKGCLIENPTDLVIIGCEEESVLAKRKLPQNERVPDNFNFQKLFPVCDKFILTFDLSYLYVFDPSSSKLVFWTMFSSPIKDITFVNDVFYIWKNNLEINLLSVAQLEHVILGTLYKKQYYLCAELCIEFRAELLRILEESKNKLYLISVLKTKILSNDLMEKLGPVLEKVDEINEKMHEKQTKNQIVVVENLFSDEEIVIAPTCDENKDFKLVLKQYKLNKTHKTVDIPEVTRFLESIETESLFTFFAKFNEYVAQELEEDSTQWSQEQYLKHISKKNANLNSLSEESVEFLTAGIISANSAVKFSCSCGYPLPKARRFKPKHPDVAFNLLNARKNENNLLENIPYLWRYKGKTEIYGVNMTLLVQYSDLELFRELTLNFKYDNWHDILGYFTKINKGLCLNCDNKIDIEGLLTWTDVARVIQQSIGAKSTLRILEKYHKVIPNGALDASFYQTCIFAHSFNSDNSTTGVEPEASVNFVKGLDKTSYAQFQHTMEKYLKRKYNEKKSPSFVFLPENIGTCLLCNLPLKNDVLFECENSLVCRHKFHKFCYERNKRKCNVCVTE